jgi:hypothetical protein
MNKLGCYRFCCKLPVTFSQEVGVGYGTPLYRRTLRHENITMLFIRDLEQCP